ncbi:ABC transporter permease [Agrobacterium tumefaciens]|uniref:ABC transporter permease n=1 Tax=Agrobacterium tumefaciens TaxID=358 RepID=UPI001571D5B6|nr:ABC transporter permease [Agrobacterium tumefaciens]NTE65148.1 ABC transporter permease [Agrobacterium tumefaciens]
MKTFLVQRAIHSGLLLLLVSFVGFMVLHLAPGGPLAQFGMDLSKEDITRIEGQMGLDRPLLVQYLDWLVHLCKGDWGHSYRDSHPVLFVISSHLPATLELMGTATVLAIAIALVLGVVGALKQYSVFDTVITVVSMVALSIPTFWFGFLTIYVFSVKLGWLPAGNQYTIGDGSVLDYALHLIAPSLVLAIVEVAVWSRYTRASVLDVIKQDFVRTARAKGLSDTSVLFRHILRNALLPMIALLGLQLPALLSGALVTETVFTWPGMGRLFIDSIGYRDYPVVMGLLMFSALLVIVGNFLADVLSAVADPRIRLS